MQYLFLFSFVFLLGWSSAVAQQSGIFTESAEVGNARLKGSALFDANQQVYTLSGSGTNMWGRTDQFHLAPVKLSGDFILTAACRFEGKGVNLHRKMGLIIRADLSAGSAYADAALHGDGLTSLQFRSAPGEITNEVKASVKAPDFLQLERKGDTIILRCAKKGEPLSETGRILQRFDSTVYAGLFICSHDSTVIEKGVFSNFRIDRPAPENVDGYRYPSASRLELLDTETGLRKVIYVTKEHIEAPNWSPDGKYLVYNSGGLLYKFPLETGIPEKINTGEVNKINNDHGISFDGKMLAISASARMPDGRSGSAIFTLPVGGGIPMPVTREVPSYWHGWSPDGKTLVYCAERKGDYDVWGIPSAGGDEFQLTHSKGLDDGPEYSPDGKFIYFNSVRSGKMKIWRMAPDGSRPEQVSYGPFNDWFAHISPDGTKMIWVSFPAEVPAGSHPTNKRVTLQVQKVNSRESSILAYIYGGQGTMNVPSWSPDSRNVAFVSYTYGNPEY